MSYSIPTVGLRDEVAMAELRIAAESPAVSLEARLVEAFAGAAVGSAGRVGGIQQILASPDVTHPERLAQLQEQLAQHTVDINLLNVLVRKAVGTAETLLRSS
ncbi:type III secretion system inner rod subunit SctI [Pseudomonas vanderleydeniana]|uniref:Type III secretion system inner rod subunit SctI n=1 Tax=Pseudomonas vanderleydeniana TaxID=2745495 RepID=A0A9E6PIB1_9PSED|nr:type III secretion system inner rod subunit SctI [Pseudomonas vanderleydeniana]QXI27096.1 type III secretion system inner rod subunit SctI [Pseudomonas vanderleydeniana]